MKRPTGSVIYDREALKLGFSASDKVLDWQSLDASRAIGDGDAGVPSQAEFLKTEAST